MAVLLEDVSGNLPFALWVHVATASNLVTASLDNFDSLGKRNAWKRNRRNNNVNIEETLDLFAVLLFNCADCANKQLLLNGHDV